MIVFPDSSLPSILIVEDDEVKRRALCEFAKEAYPRVQISTARSLDSGLRSVESAKPTLVLLDMTLPNYDQSADEPGGVTYHLGGLEFIRELEHDNVRVPVVVVTQYETFGAEGLTLNDIDIRLRGTYEAGYLGLVYYQSAVSGWQAKVMSLVARDNELSSKLSGTVG